VIMPWAWGIAAAGAVQGVAGVIVGYPFDTFKVRLQSGVHMTYFEAFRHLVVKQKWTALYRGVSLPLATMAIKRAGEFTAFEYFSKNNNAFVAGAISGGMGTLVNCPMQVIKINLQVTDRRTLASPADAIRHLVKMHGWKGLFLGLKVNLAKDVMFGSLYLGSYGVCRASLPDNTVGHFLSGGLASLMLWTLLYPIDLIKTQIQAQRHPTIRESVRVTVSAHGILGLWKGLGTVYLRVLPTSAVAMAAYEATKALLVDDGKESDPSQTSNFARQRTEQQGHDRIEVVAERA